MKKVKQKTQEITINDLARMVQNGFEYSDQKIDYLVKTGDERFKVIVDEFDRIRSDIGDIKTTLGPLVRKLFSPYSL